MVPLVNVGGRVEGFWVVLWVAGDEVGDPVDRSDSAYGDTAWRVYATREEADAAAEAVMAEAEGRYLAAVYAGERPDWMAAAAADLLYRALGKVHLAGSTVEHLRADLLDFGGEPAAVEKVIAAIRAGDQAGETFGDILTRLQAEAETAAPFVVRMVLDPSGDLDDEIYGRYQSFEEADAAAGGAGTWGGAIIRTADGAVNCGAGFAPTVAAAWALFPDEA